MTDRTRQPAVLLRRIAKLEALLEAERAMREKSEQVAREQIYELVDMRIRIERAEAALRGDDE